jgi:hypothetical protein
MLLLRRCRAFSSFCYSFIITLFTPHSALLSLGLFIRPFRWRSECYSRAVFPPTLRLPPSGALSASNGWLYCADSRAETRWTGSE